MKVAGTVDGHPFRSSFMALGTVSTRYIVFAKQRRELSEAAARATRRPPPLKIAGELIRNILLACALAYVLAYYRTLTPDAAVYFSAESGRWPEAQAAPPLWYGARVALLTTSATMIAFINSIVAGASVTLLVNGLSGYHVALAMTVGVAIAVSLVAVFLAYQQWRYRAASPREGDHV